MECVGGGDQDGLPYDENSSGFHISAILILNIHIHLRLLLHNYIDYFTPVPHNVHRIFHTRSSDTFCEINLDFLSYFPSPM